MSERKRTVLIPPCPERNFILYCDTSAIIKLLLDEQYSNELREREEKCDRIAVCRITWAEAKAALSNHERQEVQKLSRSLDSVKDLIDRYPQQTNYRDNISQLVSEVNSFVRNAHQIAHQNLEELWKSFTLIDISDNVLNKAGDFSGRFSLRGYDSVQLAAADEFQHEIGESYLLLFASFDKQLNLAARNLGIATFPEYPAN